MKIASGINGLVDGALIQQLRCDTIANNLANLSTRGFKKDNLSFGEVLSMKQTLATDFSQGSSTRTGNPFDLSIEGPGFFKVETESGLRYTRNGAFRLDENGILVNHMGDRVMGEGGPITITGNNVSVGIDGEVLADGVPAGRISLVDFEDTRVLRKEGSSYFACDPGAEEAGVPASTFLRQGYLEESNVDLTGEMIRMVEAFRTYEAIHKGIQGIDEMTGKLVNDSGLV